MKADGMEHPSDRRHDVHLARFRLALVILATALIAIVAGAVLTAMLVPDSGRRLGAAIRHAPLPWIVVGGLVFASACDLVLIVARRIAEPAGPRGPARRQPDTRSAPAEPDALVDSLTGLGNHRAFQEEFDRQLELRRGRSSATARPERAWT